MEYTQRLITARKKSGLSQTQTAEALMITQQQYSRYEKGINELPLRYLIELCKLFNVSSDWILGISETDCTPEQKDNLKKYEIRNTMTGESATMYFAENITIGDKQP